jgi:hypothetical protein
MLQDDSKTKSKSSFINICHFDVFLIYFKLDNTCKG